MTGILFAEMTPDVVWEGKFNEWYDNDHIRSRMQIRGFEGAQRYRAEKGDSYLIVYDMESLSVLKTPEYEYLKTHESEQTKWMLANVRNFTRNLGTEIGRDHFDDKARAAPLIFVSMFNVPEQHCGAFDEWMTKDHAPLLLKNKDWLAIRRFHMTLSEPHPFTRLAIHYLASPAALQSQERAAARGTPWRARMAEQHDWFREAKTSVFTRHGSFYGPTSI